MRTVWSEVYSRPEYMAFCGKRQFLRGRSLGWPIDRRNADVIATEFVEDGDEVLGWERSNE